MIEKIWRRWTRGADESSGDTPISYSDQRATKLDAVRRDLVETRTLLAQSTTRWDKLQPRTDPAAHEARDQIAPRIRELTARDRSLAAEETATEQAIAETARLVVKYAAMTAACEARWVPVLAQIAEVDAAEAFRESYELGRLANALYVATNDRQFRRLAVDPYGALLDTLTEVLRVVERQRHTRRHIGAEATASTAS